VRFGLWDHFDSTDRPLTRQFDERFEFLAAGDTAGFHCIHVAEHHATPLNLAPVPGVYLSAVARLTKRMRIGTLCYLLPLYSPLRLIEEICMLDNLSRGRFDLGVGRGVSPFELNYHNVDQETARDVFLEALDVILNGLTHERLTHNGKRFSYHDVPMELRPLQQPHPPIWYPSSHEGGATFAGERGYHFVTLGPVAAAKKNIEAYKAALSRRGGAAVPSDVFAGGTAIGLNRHIVIAGTDREAVTIARPAYAKYFASLTHLRRGREIRPDVAAGSVENLEQAMLQGTLIVGSPETVRAAIAGQIEDLGINYMTCGMFFGDMRLDDALRSLSLLATEVIPKIGQR
jgi:alkanesulfonate monooxygenase SsuD/methylene tetrahydromethanopterin reductase-like flavin-dependent oxidoreductase (luciferase family)